IGGLGLHLVRQLADHIDYRHDAGRNVVRITLLRPFDPAPPGVPRMTTLSLQIDPAQDKRQRITLGGRLDTHTYQALDEALA
ncbi:hypothetical protein Y886_41730, partial [Xanthomonas hyacinthi DSM 19077]